MNKLKKKLMFFIVFTIFTSVNCNTMFSQNGDGIDNNPNYNLPPGVALPMKFNVNIDFSYKLNNTANNNQTFSDSELRVGKILTIEQLNSIKELDSVNFNYYNNANLYFNQLSLKVKKIYTLNELWYIYVFDQDLKNKLLTIK